MPRRGKQGGLKLVARRLVEESYVGDEIYEIIRKAVKC